MRILDSSDEADDALRDVVGVLVGVPGLTWAGIGFHEGGSLVLGPTAGTQDESRRVRVPVTYEGDPVGELWVDGEAERAFLDRVAELISAHVLIGWDTGGAAWEP